MQNTKPIFKWNKTERGVEGTTFRGVYAVIPGTGSNIELVEDGVTLYGMFKGSVEESIKVVEDYWMSNAALEHLANQADVVRLEWKEEEDGTVTGWFGPFLKTRVPADPAAATGESARDRAERAWLRAWLTGVEMNG